jgi:hypothetical protein
MLDKFFKLIKHFQKDKRGNLLLFAMVFGAISFTVIIGGVAGYAVFENKASLHKHNREMAFQIAEAGINYYRWHLAHDSTDYYDGNASTSTGPYIHEYKDKDGNLIGYFSLGITPPLVGSSVVTVSSTGWITNQPNSKRTIKARVGFPALTDYAFLTNTDVWIGDSEVTSGKFHANGGIRYDGTGNAPITSTKLEYSCQDHHGCGGGQLKPGIWGSGGPTNFWSFPVPLIDFSAVTAKLAEIKAGAESGGTKISGSGYQGWHIQFLSNETFRARKVRTCRSYRGWDIGDTKFRWHCIDINSYHNDDWVTYSMPANGYIYVEDRVWVDGVVNGRATIGTSASNSIIIYDDITYLAKDGTHVLGLIAEQDILIPHNSPDDLEINAAMLAQNGAAKRYYYSGDKKENIYTYGSVITNQTWTWSWVSGGGSVVSGYKNTNSTYDANLTYNPPPGFPVGSEYNLISWEEVEY